MVLSSFIFVPVHPLMSCTLFYALGVLFAWHSPPHFAFGGLIFALIIQAALSRNPLPTFFLALAFFFLGSMRYYQKHRDSQGLHARITAQPLTCIALIKDIEHIPKKAFKKKITLRLLQQETTQGYVLLNTIICLHCLFSPPFHVGDSIKIDNLVIKPVKNKDFLEYLYKEGISATAFISSLKARLINRPFISLTRVLWNLKQRVKIAFKSSLSPSAYALCCALFLGIKPESVFYHELRNQCTYWGVVHYLARSGLHVILILSAWNIMLCFIPLNFFIKQVLLLVLILIYHLLTWPSISFLRALITFILYKLCVLQTLSYKSLHILTLTTLIILLWNPLVLFFLDFQLSFGLAFALSWFQEASFKIQRYYKTVENK